MNTTLQCDDSHFLLFASCPTVKGPTQSLIVDLQRNQFKYIPNLLYEILQLTPQLTVGQIKQQFDGEENEGIDTYFQALADEQLGFFTNDPDSFPPIDWIHEYPGIISNAIIEYKASSPYNLKDVISQIDSLHCRLIQIRLFDIDSERVLKDIIQQLHGSFFTLAEIYLPHQPSLTLENVSASLIEEHRIYPLVIYNCSEPSFLEKIEEQTNFVKSRLIVTKENLQAGKMEDSINLESFTVNLEFFTEAQNYNTGLNQKVCVDADGNIKNHFSHNSSFGNVSKDNIADIIQEKSFQNQWFVKNDMIEICRDCEYRYICTDNTSIQLTEDGYKKSKACNYNPYTGNWSV